MPGYFFEQRAHTGILRLQCERLGCLDIARQNCRLAEFRVVQRERYLSCRRVIPAVDMRSVLLDAQSACPLAGQARDFPGEPKLDRVDDATFS